jgi:RNA polymerase sigma-70 factor (family 1)
LPDNLPYDEKELLLRVADGDEKALSKIINSYWRNIFLHALTYTHSSQKAEEITQDIFLVLWNNRDKLRTIENFSAWIHIVARNKIISVMREKVRDIAIAGAFTEDVIEPLLNPSQQLESRETYKILLHGINQLPEKRREVFRLSRLNGLSNLEIAEQLQIHPVTVAQYIAKALVFLKAYLSEHQASATLAIFILQEIF